MKRKLISFFTMVALLSLTVIPSFGETNSDIEIERYTDGSYAIIETTETTGISLYAAGTKTGSKTYTYYNSNSIKAWTFTLNATFTYDGSTAKAEKASISYNTYVSGWTCAAKYATRSGAVATGIATFKYKLVSKGVSIGLKCSPSGKISSV